MAYEPKHKPGDHVNLDARIEKIEMIKGEPWYLMVICSRWLWAKAEIVDGARSGGDPFPPPPPPPEPENDD